MSQWRLRPSPSALQPYGLRPDGCRPKPLGRTALTPADVALAVFTACNNVRILAYLPQILRVGRDANGATAISYTTWILFGLSHLSTAAYALLVISDPVMAAVFVGNAACCITILALTAYKQAVHARAALSMRPPLALRLLDAAPEAVPDRR